MVSRKKRALALFLSFAFGISLVSQVRGADNSAYQKGLQLYQQRDYRGAAREFERQIQSGADPNTLYYCALSHQLSSNRTRAKQLYEYITKTYPGTALARNAGTALGQLSVLGASTPGGDSSPTSEVRSEPRSYNRSSTGGSHLSGVPDEVRLPFSRQGNHVLVDVTVNGHPLPMILDTGAEGTVIGKNHLEELGINRADGKDSYEVVGVGARKNVRAFDDKFDIKLGPIYRRDFVCSVQDYMPGTPLLGMTFLDDFLVTVDDANRSVILRKKGSTAARDASKGRGKAIAVPFELEGRSLYVNARVNGKPYKMIFDTGAGGISFSKGDWAKLGLDIPGDARLGRSQGIAGEIPTWFFNIDSLQVGPLRRDNVPVSVTDSARPCPLLGQTFFMNYRYEVDNAKHVIYFFED